MEEAGSMPLEGHSRSQMVTVTQEGVHLPDIV